MFGLIVQKRRDIVSIARTMIYADRPCYNNFVDLQSRIKEKSKIKKPPSRLSAARSIETRNDKCESGSASPLSFHARSNGAIKPTPLKSTFTESRRRRTKRPVYDSR